MNEIMIVEYQNQRVLTTNQLAEVYGTSTDNIKKNFSNNKERFVEGKHYYCLEGKNLKEFKNRVNDIHLVGKNANTLYLWTEQGASRHCKILDTDQAWKQFDVLEETYFRVKQNALQLPQSYPEALRELANKYEEIEALKLEDCKNKQIIGELRPKATYYDTILNSPSLISTTVIAKDYGRTAASLNELLHNLKIQYKKGGTWFLYQKYAQQGYTNSTTFVTKKGNTNVTMKWTQKGRLFLYEKLKENGILPLIEREDNEKMVCLY